LTTTWQGEVLKLLADLVIARIPDPGPSIGMPVGGGTEIDRVRATTQLWPRREIELVAAYLVGRPLQPRKLLIPAAGGILVNLLEGKGDVGANDRLVLVVLDLAREGGGPLDGRRAFGP